MAALLPSNQLGRKVLLGFQENGHSRFCNLLYKIKANIHSGKFTMNRYSFYCFRKIFVSREWFACSREWFVCSR